ncbi:hypothetical protein WJX74_000238 [Apatococcus lobatus]|uniref:Biogenesis of lysosome-related organelles complex 1 subunit 1 n=1 Tax=Apatococcus lobatus TaxID=904363 RepID=A0AAW1RE33_9CHLO
MFSKGAPSRKQISGLAEKEARREAVDLAVGDLRKNLTQTADAGVQQVHQQQQQISLKEKEVRHLVKQAQRHTKQWTSTADAVAGTLKEYGDIQNYLEVLDAETAGLLADLEQLAALRRARKHRQQQQQRLQRLTQTPGRTQHEKLSPPVLRPGPHYTLSPRAPARGFLCHLARISSAKMADEHATALEHARSIVQKVKAFCVKRKAMRRHWIILARDILAFASGMRSAIMLDYISEPPPVIHQLLDSIGPELSHLTGSWSVQQARKSFMRSLTAFIAFDTQQPCKRSRWALPEEVQGVLQALHPLAEALLNAEVDVVLDLGSLTVLTMPTLSGCLLGYPIVYLIDSHECGSAAASILSLEGQMLYQITSPCTVLEDLGTLDQDARTRAACMATCGIPQHLTDGVKAQEQLDGWLKSSQEKQYRGSWSLWGPVKLAFCSLHADSCTF